MATSGTVATTVFETRKVIDHAARRCELVPQQLTSEVLETAQDLLFLFLSTLSSRGIKLWNIDRVILPMYESTRIVPLPAGTEDVLDVNLRTQQRLTGTATASEGTAANAFDGDLSTDTVQTLAAGFIQAQLVSATSANTFGVLPNATGTWNISIQFSDDGITFTNLLTQSALAVVAGEWEWFDVDGVTPHQYYRLQANGTTILDVTEFVIQNLPQEIPFYQLNRTDYSNLPNKIRTGRPTQFWYDRQRVIPEAEIWPTPNFQFTFAQITAYLHRQIQDVGTLQQEIEVPQRWYLAVVTQLAKHMVREVKDANKQLIPTIDRDAAEELTKAWDGETDSSDSFFRPNISPYTK